jgi:carboxylesterase
MQRTRAACLVIHGYTGSTRSVEGLGAALEAAGFAVEVPLLPGHSTSVADLLTRRWPDWVATVDAAYRRLAEGHEQVVLVGLSMGATLAAWLAADAGDHPQVAGLACVNPYIDPPAASFRDLMHGFLDAGFDCVPGPANDVAEPDADEGGYDQWPIEPLLSLFEALDDLLPRLPEIACPVLVVTSRQDHVVPPVSSDLLAAAVSGPVERLFLDHSFHLATLDVERHLVENAVVDFALRAVR